VTEPAHKSSFLQSLAEKLHLSKPKYHIFLCVGPDCCSNEVGMRSLQFLEKRLMELGLDHGESRVQVTKTPCLKICGNGPIAVVYPGEIWYSQMIPENLELIVQQHFMKGEKVSDLSFDPPSDARPPVKRTPPADPAPESP